MHSCIHSLKRCTAAHANSWEAFSYFSVSCLLAHFLHLDAKVASSLCTAFLLLRVAYVGLYVAGTEEWVGVARSCVWLAALTVSVRMALLALAGAGL